MLHMCVQLTLVLVPVFSSGGRRKASSDQGDGDEKVERPQSGLREKPSEEEGIGPEGFDSEEAEISRKDHDSAFQCMVPVERHAVPRRPA